jgi:hypothetical protein
MVDPDHQLARVERLGDVVVGAERGALNYFGFIMMRGTINAGFVFQKICC